jgi:hypothetical protein
MITASQVAATALDALEELDQAAAPLGLYSCHDLDPNRPASHLYREWAAALQPALVRLGATDVSARAPFDRLQFHLAPFGRSELAVRRLAKVKVRRFGSVYRVDDRVDYAARWAKADLPDLLNTLRYPEKGWAKAFRMVILIAFARETHPFRQELGAVKRDMRGLELLNRSWPDRHGRAFFVGLTAWWPPSPVAA